MPNWCEIELLVSGSDDDVRAFFHANSEIEDGDDANRFNGILDFFKAVPVPEPSEPLPWPASDNLYINAWGTKRAAYEAQVFFQPGRALYRFLSAWSPPVPWCLAASARHPAVTITMTWREESMGFTGILCLRGVHRLLHSEKESYIRPLGMPWARAARPEDAARLLDAIEAAHVGALSAASAEDVDRLEAESPASSDDEFESDEDGEPELVESEPHTQKTAEAPAPAGALISAIERLDTWERAVAEDGAWTTRPQGARIASHSFRHRVDRRAPLGQLIVRSASAPRSLSAVNVFSSKSSFDRFGWTGLASIAGDPVDGQSLRREACALLRSGYGSRVRLHGLSKAELNGRFGRLGRLQQKGSRAGRYAVTLIEEDADDSATVGDERVLAVKPENFERV